MDGSAVGADVVASHARRVLGSDDLTAERHPVGFGNENWKLNDGSRCRFVLKVGDVESEAKWNSSHVAYELAADVGLPVPTLVHVGRIGDHVARIFTWIEGDTGSGVVAGSERSARFVWSVGDAVRRLHTVTQDAFSSRRDDSGPVFPTWNAYIEYRLGQIRKRCLGTGQSIPASSTRYVRPQPASPPQLTTTPRPCCATETFIPTTWS